MARTLADLGLAALELTLSGERATASRGRRVIVSLPFDHAEERGGYTYVRTAAGADLYVQESISKIRELLIEAKQLDTDPTALETK